MTFSCHLQATQVKITKTPTCCPHKIPHLHHSSSNGYSLQYHVQLKIFSRMHGVAKSEFQFLDLFQGYAGEDGERGPQGQMVRDLLGPMT